MIPDQPDCPLYGRGGRIPAGRSGPVPGGASAGCATDPDGGVTRPEVAG